MTPLANQDGACNDNTDGTGDVCLWWGANFVGSLSDFARSTSDGNLSNNFYLTPGLGQGEAVSNDSESALNADDFRSATVWTGSSFSGFAGTIQPRDFGNFNSTFKDNVEAYSH